MKDGKDSYQTYDDTRDKMRLKLVEVMQTPPKDREASFRYTETMLNKAMEKACEIETAIYEKFKTEALRQEKFRSLCYALFMKYTEFKVLILSGELSV